MKNLFYTIIIINTILILSACNKDDNKIDKTKPEINIDYAKAFPINCDTLFFGEPFELNLLFIDNQELGSFSIDIHNNFNHHSHTTEVSECNLSEKKEPIHPYRFIQEYEIPTGLKKHNAKFLITIPESDENNIYEEGDYHFYISLTDKTGWSVQKGLSIKIFHR